MIAIVTLDYLIYFNGNWYIPKNGEVNYISKVEGDNLYLKEKNGFEVFDLKGVNLGLGKPGHFAKDKAITKEEYLRWFKQMKDMGANTVRVYTIGPEDFYEAFYEFNENNDDPLYLIHGVWVDDYLLNSRFSALDNEFYKPFLEDCKNMVDVIHGRFKSRNDNTMYVNRYKNDISQWVYAYILGVEWDPGLVTYTNENVNQQKQYQGTYFQTKSATNFEIFLASIADQLVEYETEKYGQQKTIAFSNWATTDPFEYDNYIKYEQGKFASIDVEHIIPTNELKTGQFASYHIYSYYPEFYKYLSNHDENVYLQYLKDINKHHTMPVVISEFGIPSSRGKAANEEILGRNQGNMSETDQGNSLVRLYQDIKKAGNSGAIVFTWQDEWFKRTWNTMANIDLNETAYWSDYQTNEQYFGLLSFDPGEKESICYVDGNKKDWDKKDIVKKSKDFNLSMKYDEKFIYFLIEKDGFNINSNPLYIALDTTPKSGSKTCKNLDLSMEKPSDFVIEINGKENSRVYVHERYDTTRTLYQNIISNTINIFGDEEKKKDSNIFNTIILPIDDTLYFQKGKNGKSDIQIDFQDYKRFDDNYYTVLDTYETGKLVYGNANPKSPNFNSLADFCAGDGFVEIKIPWGLLNFADPTEMMIHDDYYENYGVEYIPIKSMNVGVGDGTSVIQMSPFELEKLGKEPKYHERLKESYYILQEYWNK